MYTHKNFVFEGREQNNETDGCYCSLIPSNNNYSPRSFKSEESLLTRRHTERPKIEQKVRVNK